MFLNEPNTSYIFPVQRMFFKDVLL